MASFDINNESITIPISRYKLVGLILIAGGFLVTGIFFILDAKEIAHGLIRRTPVSFVILIGIVSAAIGGVAGILFIYRLLLSSKAGLIVNLDGIYDNSTLLSVGLIRWDEITDIKEADQAGYINIFVKDPEELVDRLRNPLKKRAIRADFNKHGTPVSISEGTLRCDYNELWSLLTTRLFEYQRARKNTHVDNTV